MATALRKNEVIVAGKNGTSHIITHKAMTLQEKQRIEKLIDTRESALSKYLDEMKEFAIEANDHVEYDKVDEVAELDRELIGLEVEQERLLSRRADEFAAVDLVLDSMLEKKLNRLHDLERKIKIAEQEQRNAAHTEIKKKFDRTETTLRENIQKIQATKEGFAKDAKRQKLVRKVALSNSFAGLQEQVKDSRNSAVEQLYVEVVIGADASKVLAMLPDAAFLRKQISPERLFQMFNDNLASRSLPSDKACCTHCNSDNLQEHVRGEVYCRDCGRYGVLDPEVKKLVALPSIREIAKAQREGEPAMPLGALPAPTAPADEVEELAEVQETT